MADAKITQLAEDTALQNDDVFPMVDVTDTSMAASGTTKKAKLSTLLSWILGNITFSGARCYKSTTQSITSTLTVVTFDVESYDTDGYHDNVTNNSRLTVPTTGYYRITGSAPTASNTAARAQIRVDGSTVIAATGVGNSGASTDNGPVLTTDYYLTAGQYVEFLVAYVSTTSNAASGLGGTFFSIHRIK